MAELLIRVIDKVNTESIYLDCGCTKRGDVIVVRPDGWAWGRMELSDPQYRLVRVQDVSMAEAEALTVPDMGFGTLTGSRTAWRRAFRLDLDHPIAAALLQAMDKRPDSVVVSPLPATNLLTLKRRKPPIQDPAVFGDDPTVIG